MRNDRGKAKREPARQERCAKKAQTIGAASAPPDERGSQERSRPSAIAEQTLPDCAVACQFDYACRRHPTPRGAPGSADGLLIS